MKKKVNIFVSYSHKNSRYFDEVYESLQTVEKEFGLNLWSDQKIPVGNKWEKEIDKALKKTNIGIFLVSRAFLNSKFIDLVELPRLLAQHKKNITHIIIVVLENCTWDSRSQLNKFEVFNKGIPLWGPSKTKRLDALKRLAENIKETAKIVREKKNKTKTDEVLVEENDILPFTNQMSLISFLSPPKSDSENMIMYAAITAPAGQGKSRLIKELNKIYSKKGWDCGYVKLDFTTNVKFLVNNQPVNINITKDNIKNNKNLGKDFYDKYSRRKRGQRKPLAIFIDTSDNVTKNDILSLEKNFIEDLDQYILTDKFLSRPGKYRLILAGRNLSGDLRDTDNFERFHDLRILPFRYENVYDMIVAMNKVFGDLNEETKVGFAADILYLSGGHPGMMAKIIERYKKDKRPHPVFIDFYIKNHWGTDLKDGNCSRKNGLIQER